MKKILLCLTIAAICASCKYRDEYFTKWIVMNMTDQPVILSPHSFMNYMSPIVLPAGAEREFYYREGYGDRPSFTALLVNWKGWADENITFEILSSDGTLLKQWKYTDRDLPGKQFFNASSWDLMHYSGDSDDPRASWFFRILPEDLD